jgi:ADP-ribosyl-[dinitrogen reductase] hydrolase
VHGNITGGGWLRLKAGQVTDDTTMSLALGESILATGGVDAKAAAEAFDAWMRAKPVDIGNTVRRNLIHLPQDRRPGSRQPANTTPATAPRCAPLPVALANVTVSQRRNDENLASRAQAHVTHHNALSDAACEMLIFMVQDCPGRPQCHRGRQRCTSAPTSAGPREFGRCSPIDRKRRENPSGFVVETLQAVLQAFLATEHFRGLPARRRQPRAAMPTPPAPSPACSPVPVTGWKPFRNAG